ncbi:MAG: hypothetical protein ACFCVD_04325 [Nodosilinea sp.]
MPVLRVVDFQCQPLVQIALKPPDLVTLEFLTPENETDLKDTLTAFVDYCKYNGLPLRISRRVQKVDRTIYTNEQVLVKPNDERFLQALGDAISRYTFGNQSKRVFALMHKQ